jgi:hypothetical protein
MLLTADVGVGCDVKEWAEAMMAKFGRVLAAIPLPPELWLDRLVTTRRELPMEPS